MIAVRGPSPIIRATLLTAAFGAGTAGFGWWAVPLIGVVWGIVAKATRRPALTAAAAATLSWAVLLAWSAAIGPVGDLAGKLGGIAGAPGAVFVALTLLVPGMLAFFAARISRPGK